MDFSVYYNVDNVVKELLEKGDIMSDYKQYEGIYICSDTHDYWICRILEGYDEEYNSVEDSWIVERNKICKYIIAELIQDYYRDKGCESRLYVTDRFVRDNIINTLEMEDEVELIKIILIQDSDEGLSNWDLICRDNLDECVSSIDNGFGIKVL